MIKRDRDGNIVLNKFGKPEPKFTGHALRHFYATVCLKLGTDVLTGSRRLGHADPSVTLNWYAADIDDPDQLEEELPPIWRERLARAEPEERVSASLTAAAD